jgi:hypothetical protein
MMDALAGDGTQAALASGASIALSIAAPQPTPAPLSPTQGYIAPESPPPPNARVNGRPAWFYPTSNPRQAMLSWELDPELHASLEVIEVADAGAVASRFADGLVPDTGSACETSMRFGWLPPNASQVWRIEVGGLRDRWSQSVEIWPGTLGGEDAVSAYLTTATNPLGDGQNRDPVTLLGRPGYSRAAGGYGEAIVELDLKRFLRVQCNDPRETAGTLRDWAVRVLNDMTIGPDPYLGWIGHREGD